MQEARAHLHHRTEPTLTSRHHSGTLIEVFRVVDEHGTVHGRRQNRIKNIRSSKRFTLSLSRNRRGKLAPGFRFV